MALTIVPPNLAVKSYDTELTIEDTDDTVSLLACSKTLRHYTASESTGGEQAPKNIGVRRYWHACMAGPVDNIQSYLIQELGFKVGIGAICSVLIDIGLNALRDHEHVGALTLLRGKFASSPRVNDSALLPLKAKHLIKSNLDLDLEIPTLSGKNIQNINIPLWLHTDAEKIASDLGISTLDVCLISIYRGIAVQPEGRAEEDAFGLHGGEIQFAREQYAKFCEELRFRAINSRGLMGAWGVWELEAVK